MRRLLDSLIVLGIVSAPILAAADNGSSDDPAEQAAEKAAVAKKDLKGGSGGGSAEPMKAGSAPKPTKVRHKKVVEPKVKHAHDSWTDKELHDPTDLGR